MAGLHGVCPGQGARDKSPVAGQHPRLPDKLSLGKEGVPASGAAVPSADHAPQSQS